MDSSCRGLARRASLLVSTRRWAQELAAWPRSRLSVPGCTTCTPRVLVHLAATCGGQSDRSAVRAAPPEWSDRRREVAEDATDDAQIVDDEWRLEGLDRLVGGVGPPLQ